MKKKPNPVAKALSHPVCRQRVIVNKKVYNRKKVRHPVASFTYLF